MSKPKHPVSLHILDKEYKIACAMDEQQELIHSAQELDRQMREIRDTGKVSGADRIAVLAALNLLHDASADKLKVEPVAEGIVTRLNILRSKIENVLENS